MSNRQTRRQFILNAGYMATSLTLFGCGSDNSNDSNTNTGGGEPVWIRIPTQAWIVGVSVYLDLNDYVTDPDGDALTIYLDNSLPDGITISNGVISGTPTTESTTAVYVATAGGVSQSFTISVSSALGGQLDLPLYDTSKIEYLGLFLLPTIGGTINGQPHDGFYGSPDQGGGGIAFNPHNNSLFVTGSTTNNDRVNTILAEISIPTPSLSAPFNTASFIQDFTLACGLNRQAEVNGGQAGNGAPVTGMMVSNNRLLMTVAGLYINDPTSSCMFARPSLDLTDNTVLGPYRITEENQRIVGNGMGCELPTEWQSVFLGYKAIVGGGGNLSLMNNAGYGPGFHFFNPDDVQGSTAQTVPGVNACYYTDIAGSGYPFTPGHETDVWNGMSTHRGTIVLPETRTFMAYGCGGSDAFYDTGGVITGSWQGTYATGGTMNDRFYLYDARDLKQAFDGNQSPLNNIRPYATFDMDFCLRNSDIKWISELDQVRTLGFDAVNRMAYVHERSVGIHVLRFNV